MSLGNESQIESLGIIEYFLHISCKTTSFETINSKTLHKPANN